MPMVKLQSCAGLVTVSTLCAMRPHVNGDSVSAVEEISTELDREKRKNAELLERIATLEAQIKETDRESFHKDNHVSCCPSETERIIKKSKRQKEDASFRIETASISDQVIAKHESQCILPKSAKLEHRLVNWMSMDDTSKDNSKDIDSTGDYDFAENSEDEDNDYSAEDDINTEHNDVELDEKLRTSISFDERMKSTSIEHLFCGHGNSTKRRVGNEASIDGREDTALKLEDAVHEVRERKDHENDETKMVEGCKPPRAIVSSEKDIYHAVSGSIPMQNKSSKVAFCPKEVKNILHLEALKLKNAQSHTMRKIIVFASLGIRHGCEDMYELDFNHFSILQRGEPYVSVNNPGEHVLYENPGARKKIFYPNRQNPTLCPVQILEEEKAMRPSNTSCPSCLFLCIKYGGRTRNLPQNEYVRQRMGRNKLKSFGPIMCRMARLVHVRSGSFFFKALGITLLFMAGFPDDMVQRETKHHNLDLLQKYYRTDEDAKGKELFLPQPVTCNNEASPVQQSSRKTTSTKPKAKKQTNSTNKHQYLLKPRNQSSVPFGSEPLAQFGLTGYKSNHTHAMAARPSMPSHSAADSKDTANHLVTSSVPNTGYRRQTTYPMFPLQPPNAFMPMMYWAYWPPQNAFPPPYGFRPFPSFGRYITIHPQTFYGHSYSPFSPKKGESNEAMEEAHSDSESTSSSTEAKESLPKCSQ